MFYELHYLKLEKGPPNLTYPPPYSNERIFKLFGKVFYFFDTLDSHLYEIELQIYFEEH